MKTLFIIRHAETEWGSKTNLDFDRELTSKGKEDANWAGKVMSHYCPKPDLFISSSAIRAKSTANAISKFIRNEIVDFDKEIYDADLGKIVDIVGKTESKVKSLVLVGHNPTLTQLVDRLSNISVNGIPPAGIVMLELEIDSWDEIAYKTGKLIFFKKPQEELT